MLLLLQPHGAEQLAMKPTLNMSQTLDRDSSRIFQDPLQTQSNQIN